MIAKKELPERWIAQLDTYRSRPEAEYDQLSVADFVNDIRIEFPDRSYALFHGAFYIAAENLNEIGVFTEHCGHHVFPIGDTKLETFDPYGKLVKTELFSTE